MFHDRIEVVIVPDDEPCLRCNHPESDHASAIGFCDAARCACQGFLSAESFESEAEEVGELHLGEESE